MYTYKNVAIILNTQIMPNATGENAGITIAEDLSNLVEVLKAINADNPTDLRNALTNIITGVHNEVVSRMLKTKHFKMLRNAIEFGGGIQRIMQTGLFTAQESHILNLAYGEGVTPYSYHDGKFYGSEASAAVQTMTETFKVVHSVADTFYSTWFTNAADLVKWVNDIAIKEENTIKMQLANLEQRIINMAIAQANAGNRVVHLLTMFNDLEGRTETGDATLTNNSKWTKATLMKYRDEFAYFQSYTKSIVARLVDYVKRPNKKYNNGEILTWVPTDEIGVILNTQFATEIDFLGAIEFRNKDFTVDFETVDTWQDLGGGMLPDYSTTTKILIDGGEDEDIEINDVVGFVYDAAGLCVVNKLSKITVEIVGAEGFENYHNHQANSYFVDPRLSAVVLKFD